MRPPTPYLATPSSRPRSRSGSRTSGSDGRCRKAICQDLKDRALAAEKAASVAEKAHAEILFEFDAKVRLKAEGEIRVVMSELSVANRKLEECERELKVSKRQRSFARAREAECVDLIADKKILVRRIRILESDALAVAKKRAVLERRQLTVHASDLLSLREGIAGMASESVRVLKDASARIAAAEAEAESAFERESIAKVAEADASEAAEEAALDLADAEKEKDAALYDMKIVKNREKRLRKRLNRDNSSDGCDAQRSNEERASLSRDATYKRDSRERTEIRKFLATRSYLPRNICKVLKESGLLSDIIFKTSEGFDIYFDAVQALFARVETEHYGVAFALYLHYECHMTFPAILKLTQAGCKQYKRETDKHETKVALYHPFKKGKIVKVPRLAPPASQLFPLKAIIEAHSGVSSDENGRIARRSIETAYAELLTHGAGKYGAPTLEQYEGCDLEVPFVGSWDATGHGKLQVSTAVLRNPYAPHSGQQLHILSVGNCDDGRSGVARLLGKENIFLLNHWSREKPVFECEVRGRTVRTRPRPYVSTDVSSVRHCEHIAASGWCSCSRDFALRTTPNKPDSIPAMYDLLKKCVSPTSNDRFIKSHSILPGEVQPRPCPCCSFGHANDPAVVMAEYEALLAEAIRLASDRSKAGKARYSKWRMEFAKQHENIQPGEFGRPQLEYDMDDFILDLLHLAELGIPKTLWKHGVLNNCSDDAREAIEELLRIFKHRIDCKRKDANRVTADKWFTGEAWSSLCAGTRGSPGGPEVIAKCVKIFADDMQKRGVTIGAGTAEEEAAAVAKTASNHPTAPKTAPVLTGKAGKAARLAALAASAAPTDDPSPVYLAKLASLQHIPTAMEKNANPEHLALIHEVYGSRAQTIINTLLSFDAYFAWYYPLKDLKDIVPFGDDGEEAAYHNIRSAIDLHDITERVTVRNHKSFLFHGAIYKVTRDILKVTNPWAMGIQSLELQNAETKRVASKNGARNIEFRESSLTRVAMKHGQAGPMRLTSIAADKKGTTMAISILKFLLSKRHLKRGDGVLKLPDSRQSERVFGEGSAGRSKLASAGMKLELLGTEMIPPRGDSCLAAFVREMAATAAET